MALYLKAAFQRLKALLVAIEAASAQFPAINRTTLFSSIARGAFSGESDIDIRLELERSKHFKPRDLAHFTKQIKRPTGCEVGIVSADAIKGKQLAGAIAKDGVRI